jgi:hypothetical protein
MDMIRNARMLATAVFIGIAWAPAANALPGAPVTPAAPPESVIAVHGCHRSCEFGPLAGWHRHGPFCAPIACVPRAYYPGRCWVDWRGVRFCRW